MDKDLILEVKKKREFSQLPDSIIEKALISNKSNVKEARAFLRKYFGVFLTNRVLKTKEESVLKYHISSKQRDYALFYKKIHEVVGKNVESIIDLGCGANGFSYPFLLEEFGKVDYWGLEASGQLVKSAALFFAEKKFVQASALCVDLFDLEKVKKIILESSSPKIILILQTLDALESVEKNYSKKFLLDIRSVLNSTDAIIISSSLKSISGKEMFRIKRRWLEEFVNKEFKVISNFEMFDEEFTVLKS